MVERVFHGSLRLIINLDIRSTRGTVDKGQIGETILTVKKCALQLIEINVGNASRAQNYN